VLGRTGALAEYMAFSAKARMNRHISAGAMSAPNDFKPKETSVKSKVGESNSC
jgi:hypothetical protein